MKTVKITVEGTVTGVGFRFSAQREARRHPLVNGYVRNLSPRQVEAVLQGPDSEVDEFSRWFRNGPSSARVISCTVTPVASATTYDAFSICQ